MNGTGDLIRKNVKYETEEDIYNENRFYRAG